MIEEYDADGEIGVARQCHVAELGLRADARAQEDRGRCDRACGQRDAAAFDAPALAILDHLHGNGPSAVRSDTVDVGVARES